MNLVIPFDDKANPEDLNACKGDKDSASLNSKIEAVNLRGNNNFYSRPLFQFSISSGFFPLQQIKLCEIQDHCVYLL